MTTFVSSGTAVVHHNHFVCRTGLCEDAVERLRQKPAVVVGRDEDADGGRHKRLRLTRASARDDTALCRRAPHEVNGDAAQDLAVERPKEEMS